MIGTYLGLSPDHRGLLEGAEMQPFDLNAESITLTDLSSEFLDRFSSAQEADTLLMTNVGVTWRRTSADLTTA